MLKARPVGVRMEGSLSATAAAATEDAGGRGKEVEVGEKDGAVGEKAVGEQAVAVGEKGAVEGVGKDEVGKEEVGNDGAGKEAEGARE